MDSTKDEGVKPHDEKKKVDGRTTTIITLSKNNYIDRYLYDQ